MEIQETEEQKEQRVQTVLKAMSDFNYDPNANMFKGYSENQIKQHNESIKVVDDEIKERYVYICAFTYPQSCSILTYSSLLTDEITNDIIRMVINGDICSIAKYKLKDIIIEHIGISDYRVSEEIHNEIRKYIQREEQLDKEKNAKMKETEEKETKEDDMLFG